MDQPRESSQFMAFSDGDQNMDLEEDDFLMIMDDMEEPSVADDNNFDHLQTQQEVTNVELPPLYQQDQNKQSPPQSPIPNEINVYGRNDIHHVTPEQQANSPLRLPDAAELQLQYKRTLKKLAKSMRRSDATRNMVKRQRSASYSVGSAFSSDDDLSEDFFCGTRAAQMEQSRRKLMQLIHQET